MVTMARFSRRQAVGPRVRIAATPRSLLSLRLPAVMFAITGAICSPTLGGWVQEGRCDVYRGASALAVAGNYAYVGNSATNLYGLHVIDISNPASPVVLGRVPEMPWPADPSDTTFQIALSGNYAYLARGESGLDIVDVSDPASPQRVGRYAPTSCYPYLCDTAAGVGVANSYIYLSDDTTPSMSLANLDVIDASNPASPQRVGGCSLRPAGRIAISGTYAIVAGTSMDSASDGMQVLDVSNPLSPQVLGFTLLENARDVAIEGSYAYVAAGGGLKVVDIQDPAQPQVVGVYDTPGSARAVFVSGSRAYVADYNAGLAVIDISNPASPRWESGYDTTGLASDLVVSGDYVYLADGLGGFVILRHTDDPEHSAVFKLVNPGPGTVPACSTITLEVRATFDGVMAAANFTILASEDNRAEIVGRSVASDLAYVSTDIDNALSATDLPQSLLSARPRREVLMGVAKAWKPGDPQDGLGPGTDVLIETLAIEVSGQGPLTLSLATSGANAPGAIETQTDPAGKPFDTVSVDGGAGSVTVTVGPCAITGDFDADCDVDFADYLLFEACVSGPAIPFAPGCDVFDLDPDGDTDQDDFGIFQRSLLPPGNPAPTLSHPGVTGSLQVGVESTVQLSCYADDDGNIVSVTADLTAIGGPASLPLTLSGDVQWKAMTTVAPPTSGAHPVTLTAIDDQGAFAVGAAEINVAP